MQTLTNALKTYKAQQEATGKPIIFDQVVFALIPDLDPEVPIDPDETLPAEEYIQYRYDIPDNNKRFINPNAVVYSCLLGTDIGTWSYNAIYLVNKENNLAGSIIHEPEQTKVEADPTGGIAGDTLTRNIVTSYENAQQLTQINVSADTWQLDFNARLSAMDDRVRQNNLTEYGDASFIGDGWKVNHIAGRVSATIDPGVGYVGGLKAQLYSTETIDLTGVVLPKTVYLITTFQGQANSAWHTQPSVEIANSLPSHWISNGASYYSTPIALLSSSEDAQDLRTPHKDTEFERKDNAATNEDIDNESTEEKHVKLPQYWRGIQKYVTEKLWLALASKIHPIGAPIEWLTDTPPDGFAIMKGQAFDTVANPELAKVFPDGIIPDFRGCGVIGKEDSETIGVYEEGQVKEHGHPGSAIGSTNLGTKTSNTTGNHAHYTTFGRNLSVDSGAQTNLSTGASNNGGSWSPSTNTTGNHAHTTAIGSHAHTIAVALFGALKNTINHRKVNWIVRMA